MAPFSAPKIVPFSVPKNWNPKFNIFGSTSGPKMGRLSWNPKKKQKFQPKAEP